MVEQYGNWCICSVNPNEHEEVLTSLNKDMNSTQEELDKDFSKGKVDYIYKEMNDMSKIQNGLDLTKPYWTAAWKVTL